VNFASKLFLTTTVVELVRGRIHISCFVLFCFLAAIFSVASY